MQCRPISDYISLSKLDKAKSIDIGYSNGFYINFTCNKFRSEDENTSSADNQVMLKMTTWKLFSRWIKYKLEISNIVFVHSVSGLVEMYVASMVSLCLLHLVEVSMLIVLCDLVAARSMCLL